MKLYFLRTVLPMTHLRTVLPMNHQGKGKEREGVQLVPRRKNLLGMPVHLLTAAPRLIHPRKERQDIQLATRKVRGGDIPENERL